jgi:Xaa-Pro aminopeptidase
MAKAFPKAEYAARLLRVRGAMQQRGLDAMVVGDPANMNWLTGFDAWSFYVPQIMVVSLEREPVWIGREMDAGAAALTTYMDDADVIPYPEDLVQRPGSHASEYMAGWMKDNGFASKTIGYESDVYYFSAKALAVLQSGLPNATWSDADLLVNWARVVKSEAEIQTLSEAAVLAGLAQRYAWDNVRPGVRQCDLAAGIYATAIGGTPEFGGDSPAISALILAGEAASTAHPMWTDAVFEENQTVAFELGGCRKRYNAGLARTVQLGKLPAKVAATATAVEEGLDRVLESLKAGAIAGDVHAAWHRVLEDHGLEKKSRIGYSIGVAYAPDWGEHTISLRAGEETVIPENAVIHVMLGMWMEGWGMELSETVHVTASGSTCLTDFPRGVHVID